MPAVKKLVCLIYRKLHSSMKYSFEYKPIIARPALVNTTLLTHLASLTAFITFLTPSTAGVMSSFSSAGEPTGSGLAV